MARHKLPTPLVEGPEWCTRCNQETEWRFARRGQKFLLCNSCGDRFPCGSKKCGHQDCERVAGVEPT